MYALPPAPLSKRQLRELELARGDFDWSALKLNWLINLCRPEGLATIEAAPWPETVAFFRLDGSKIFDISSFLVECDAKFPHETHLYVTGSLDAFSDWLSSEFGLLNEKKAIHTVYVIWENADQIIDRNNLEELLGLAEVFCHIESKRSIRLRFILVGTGLQFK